MEIMQGQVTSNIISEAKTSLEHYFCSLICLHPSLLPLFLLLFLSQKLCMSFQINKAPNFC